jgi:hypothetical protein
MWEQLQRLSRDAGRSNVGVQILLVDRPRMADGELSAFLFFEPSSGPGRPNGADPKGDRVTLAGRPTGTLSPLSESTA